MCKILKLDTNKNDKRRLEIEEGWENHKVFGSLYNSRIKERNKEGIVVKYDGCISILNARCHPFLVARILTLG